jgi:hypothetical protein
MDKKSDKSFWPLLLYFLFALIFALLSVLASKHVVIQYARLSASVGLDIRWVFWLLVLLSLVCLAPLIVAIFRDLHERKGLPGFLDFFFQEQFRVKRDRMMWNVRTWLFGRIGLSVIAGAAILLLLVFLNRTSAVDDDEVNGNLYEVVLNLRGVEHPRQSFSKVAQLLYLTLSKDSDEELRDLLNIVANLKSAGAKALLITLPEFPPSGKEAFPLMRELENTGIVVWGVPYGSFVESQSRLSDSLGGVRPTLAYYQTPSDQLWRGPYLSRLWRVDVALSLLRKYHNYPYYQLGEEVGGELVFGDYRIPVTRKGWMYAVDRYTASTWPDVYVHRGEWWRVGMQVGGPVGIRGFQITTDGGSRRGTDTLGYYVYKWRSRTESPWLAIDRKTFEEKVIDRIVLLMGNYGSVSGSYPPDRAYAVGLESILRGDVMKKAELGYLWLSLACVALAGLFAYRFRPLVAVLLMFVLAACALLAGSYLYDSQNILVDIFYPLLSIGIAMIVFPAITVAHKMREAEEAF